MSFPQRFSKRRDTNRAGRPLLDIVSKRAVTNSRATNICNADLVVEGKCPCKVSAQQQSVRDSERYDTRRWGCQILNTNASCKVESHSISGSKSCRPWNPHVAKKSPPTHLSPIEDMAKKQIVQRDILFELKDTQKLMFGVHQRCFKRLPHIISNVISPNAYQCLNPRALPHAGRFVLPEETSEIDTIEKVEEEEERVKVLREERQWFTNQLLQEKDRVNKRIDVKMTALSESILYPRKDAPAGSRMCLREERGHFLIGFGFSLANDFIYSHVNQPELSKMYDAITSLQDKETKDYLLCFLDDFKRKQEILKDLCRERSTILTQVTLWLNRVQVQEDMDKLHSSMKTAKDAGSFVLERFALAADLYDELHGFALVKRRMSDIDMQEQSAIVDLHERPMCREIACVLDQLKIQFIQKNSAQVKKVEKFVKTRVKVMLTQELKVEDLKQAIEQKKLDIENVPLQTKMFEDEIAALTVKVKLLEEEKMEYEKYIESQIANSTVVEAMSVRRRREAARISVGVQTDPITPAKKPSSKKKSPRSESAASPKGTKNITGNTRAPKRSVSVKESLCSTDPTTASDTEENCSELGESVSQMSNETTAELLNMVNAFCKGISEKICITKNVLLQMQNEAEKEMDSLKNKQEQLASVADNIQLVVDTLQDHASNLPSSEFFDSEVIIEGRIPLAHKCRFCVCHSCQETSVLDTHETARAAGKMLNHCMVYTDLLCGVKSSYKAICQLLLDAKDFLDQTWEQVHSDTGSHARAQRFSSHLHDFDMRSKAAAGPHKTLKAALDNAKIISSISTQMMEHTIPVLRDIRQRIEEVKKQSEPLDEMEQRFDEVEEIFNCTAMDLARLRCRQDFLKTGRMLKNCQCPYCLCYNAPFEEGLRTWKAPGASHEDAKSALTQALSYLKQGARSVLAFTPVPGGVRAMVSGIHPNELTALGETTTLLIKMIDDTVGRGPKTRRVTIKEYDT